jgi:hypothetical protein
MGIPQPRGTLRRFGTVKTRALKKNVGKGVGATKAEIERDYFTAGDAYQGSANLEVRGLAKEAQDPPG